MDNEAIIGAVEFLHAYNSKPVLRITCDRAFILVSDDRENWALLDLTPCPSIPGHYQSPINIDLPRYMSVPLVPRADILAAGIPIYQPPQ